MSLPSTANGSKPQKLKTAVSSHDRDSDAAVYSNTEGNGLLAITLHAPPGSFRPPIPRLYFEAAFPVGYLGSHIAFASRACQTIHMAARTAKNNSESITRKPLISSAPCSEQPLDSPEHLSCFSLKVVQSFRNRRRYFLGLSKFRLNLLRGIARTSLHAERVKEFGNLSDC